MSDSVNDLLEVLKELVDEAYCFVGVDGLNTNRLERILERAEEAIEEAEAELEDKKPGNPDWFRENRGPPMSAEEMQAACGITEEQRERVRKIMETLGSQNEFKK
mgnify:CR=1 FL=1